jgi:predicted nucleic acid-binding protein
MIFVDTSAWLALADSRDRDHSRAIELHRRIVRGEFGKQVTSNYVMTETLTIIRRRLGLPQALELAKAVRVGTQVGLFWIESVHHNEAIELMASHADKDWSLTDCSSFVLMRSLAVRDAFTFDRDFTQAGFVARP